MESAPQFGILGPLELRHGDRTANLGGMRQRAVLAVLLLHANHVVSTDTLIDQLWPEQAPPTAVHTIQVFVSRLRRALAPADGRLVTRRPGYALELADDELDAARCERLYARGRAALAAADAETAARLLGDAERLWRGPSLADFTYEPFAQAGIARLQELRESCREERIEAELELGLHAKLVSELEELIRAHPLRERLRGQLMLALYRSDRQAEALDAFQQARRMLVDDLGVQPGDGLRKLEEAILRQDVALLPRRPAAPPPRPSSMATGAGSAPPPARSAVVRKTVTVLVGTLASGGPQGGADPEVARRLIALGRREAEQIVARHGGTFKPGLGGEVVGVFGLSLTREDDALRALRAAEELSGRVTALAQEEPAGLVIRLGLDTGEVVAEISGDRSSLFGEPIEGGVALARTAQPGEILVSDATRRLAPDAVRAAPVDAGVWRLDAIIPGAPAFRRRQDAPMVGRDGELAAALAAFDRATRRRRTELLTVVGEAGLGKSRLAQEFGRRLPSGATILSAQCHSYGDGSSLWPLRAAITRLAGGHSRDAILRLLGDAEDRAAIADLVAAALGLDAREAAGERVPWAFRRLIEVLAEHRSVVLIVEDAHWAEPPLLDLIEHLTEWLTTAPVLALCLARPELLDARPGWGGGRAGVASVVLAPLADDAAKVLLESLMDEHRLSSTEAAEVLRTAEGNPLFIEQILAMRTDVAAWGSERRIPASVQALLAARLDRLGPGERAVIDRAAVIGHQFWSSAVVELLPAEARPNAGQHLRELVHRGLISPDGSTLPGEQALRFHHILIRDVAYGGCPKALRSRLHEDCAAWLGRHGHDQDEFVGYHLEQAFYYRRELGQLDGGGLALAKDAAERLAAAGRRAHARGDANSAIGLLRRSADLFEAGAGVRPDVLIGLGRALCDSGDCRAAVPVLEAALEAARAARADTLVARALIELSNQRVYLELDAEAEDMLTIAEGAIEIFARAHDEAGLARASSHIGLLHWARGRCAEMEHVLERALVHADRAGDARDRSEILNGLARATVFGPRPVEAGVDRCRAIRERAGEDVVLAAVTDLTLAVLEAMSDRIAAARDLYRGAREQFDDLGLGLRLAGLEVWATMVELIAGDPRVSEPGLVRAYAALDRVGERGRLSTIAAFLSRTHYAQGRLDEALRFTQLSEGLASEHDAASQILWRGTRARVLARLGDGRQAERLARASVALAGNTDFVYLHAEALADLADVLCVLDQPHAAGVALDDALALHDAKHNRASAKGLRALRRSLVTDGQLDAARPSGYKVPTRRKEP